MDTTRKSLHGSYIYQPLEQDSSIRLLVLEPGLPGTPITCSLIHATLADCERDIYDQYTALSYVWGDAHNTTTITIDRCPFDVTVNLAAALDALRDAERTLRVWADAVCINQTDPEERNEQVSLMREIYSLANNTVVFLGSSSDRIDHMFSPTPKSIRESSARFWQFQGEEKALNDSVDAEIAREIISRPWFSRVWTYQELVLAQRVWVQCGRRRIEWDDLCQRISITAHKAEDFDSESIRKMQSARTKSRTALISQGNSPRSYPTLHEILTHRRGQGVTDPRDMIYGHLAICGLSTRLLSRTVVFEVDYKKSVSQVFVDAWKLMIDQADRLDLLEDLGLEIKNSSPPAPEGLPSWVPNWLSKPVNPNSLPWKSICPPMAWIPTHASEIFLDPIFFDDPAVLAFYSQHNVIGWIQYINEIPASPPSTTDEALKADVEFSQLFQKMANEPFSNLVRDQPAMITESEFSLYRKLYSIWETRLGSLFHSFDFQPAREEDLKIRSKANALSPPNFGFQLSRDILDYSFQPSKEKDSIMSSKVKALFSLYRSGQNSPYWLRGAPLDIKLMLYLLKYKSCGILDGTNLAMLSGNKIAIVPAAAQQGDLILAMPREIDFSKYYAMSDVSQMSPNVNEIIFKPITFSPLVLRPLDESKVTRQLDPEQITEKMFSGVNYLTQPADYVARELREYNAGLNTNTFSSRRSDSYSSFDANYAGGDPELELEPESISVTYCSIVGYAWTRRRSSAPSQSREDPWIFDSYDQRRAFGDFQKLAVSLRKNSNHSFKSTELTGNQFPKQTKIRMPKKNFRAREHPTNTA